MERGITPERRRAMSQYPYTDGRDHGSIATVAPSSDGSRGDTRDISETVECFHLRVGTIERTVVVRFENAEILFEERAVQTVGGELHRLIEEGGHTRLVVNFAGVRYVMMG
jgi:hypothetical protein